MKRSKRKLKTRLGKKVLSGKMTVTEARARLGRDLARKSGFAPVVKTARAQGRAAAETEWLAGQRHLTVEALREATAAIKSARPITEQDVLDAARPMARPVVTKAAVPAAREHPLQVLKTIKSMGPEATAPIRPPHHWTGIELALLRKSQTDPDPRERENARATLARELGGKVVF